MRTAALRLLVAVALAAIALLAVSGSLSDPVRWTPDGLFYEARSLELRGVERDAALERVFEGPLGADLRVRDPERSGDPDWVRYNAQFYERRVTVPAAAAALEPLGGERTILNISVAGYVAAVLALFALLLLRFRLGIAAAVTAATIVLPALTATRLPAHRQLGPGSRDRGVRRGHPRAGPRPALAAGVGGRAPGPVLHP